MTLDTVLYRREPHMPSDDFAEILARAPEVPAEKLKTHRPIVGTLVPRIAIPVALSYQLDN